MSNIYPNLSNESRMVLIVATETPGAAITPEFVAQTLARFPKANTPGDPFLYVRGQLDAAHMLDEDGTLTPLADNYGRMWRKFLKTANDAGRASP